ncbi:putative yir1 protein, partial [Plasmodium yoelii yoelii]
CGQIDLLRMCLPDESGDTPKSELQNIKNYNKYCPNGDCNSEIDQITIGFLWLLGQYFTEYPTKDGVINYNKPFFLYIILWLSYKLNQNTEENFTKINDFYDKYVKNSNKYSNFKDGAYKILGLGEFMNKHKDLLDIDIKDLSKFYDASKLICSMYSNVAQSQTSETLSNDATSFVQKYIDLSNKYNNESALNLQILPALLTDYNNLNKKCRNIPPFSEIESKFSALASEDTSSSSIGNRFFTVLSIFGAIALFLGISYKVNNKELKKIIIYMQALTKKSYVS